MLYPSSNLFAAFCLLVLIFHGCNQASPETQKTKHLERAAEYMEKGLLQEALIEYMNVTKADPVNAEAYYQMAVIHLKLGGRTNLQKAFSELTRTLELNKNNRDAQLKISELYLLGNEPVKAREQADLILASAPQDTDALIIRGRSLLSEQRHQDGIAELKKALARDPKNTGIYLELSRAYFFAKDHAAAENMLYQGLTAIPGSTDLMLALGDFQLSLGKPDLAEASYKKVVDIAPENEVGQLRLAGLYQRINKLVEAEGVLQKWAAAYPQNEHPQINLGDFYSWIGNPGNALASYKRAEELNPKSAIARDKLITTYLDAGNLTAAEPKVKAILDQNPSDLSGRFFDTRILMIKGNLDEAISRLQILIKNEPQLAPAHYFQGLAYLKKHQRSQARNAFTEAVKLNPGMPEARTSLAELLLAEGSVDLALEHAQAAVQLNPRNVQAAVITGDAYLRKGDVAKSTMVYEAIAKALPQEAIGPYRLGLVARVQKNDAKALGYFEEALARKPTAIEPIGQIASVKLAQGKVLEARERVMTQIGTAPTSPLLYDLLGQLWMAEKDMGRAETAFKKALELDSALLGAYLNLGQVYYQTGKTDQAAAEYEAVLAKEPKTLQAHMMLGIIHDQKKEYDKAKARYEKILAFNPKFAPAANNLAWLLVDQGGNLDVALNHAQSAREQQPTDPSIADTMGWLYYKKNAYVLALGLLKEAVEKLPTNPLVQFHMGMTQYKNGDKAGAKNSLQTALKLDPHFPGSDEARTILGEL